NDQHPRQILLMARRLLLCRRSSRIAARSSTTRPSAIFWPIVSDEVPEAADGWRRPPAGRPICSMDGDGAGTIAPEPGAAGADVVGPERLGPGEVAAPGADGAWAWAKEEKARKPKMRPTGRHASDGLTV